MANVYFIKLKNGYDPNEIARLAGFDLATQQTCWVEEDRLCTHTSQQRLDDALAVYISGLPNIISDTIVEALQQIDYKAGEVRAKYITVVPGQSETYLLKATEADAYKAAGYPSDLTNYPFINAEAIALNTEPRKAANNIISKRDAWKSIGVEIEKQRIFGKRMVNNSTTLADVIKERDKALAVLESL